MAADVTAAALIPAYAHAGIRVLPLHGAPDGRCTCGRDCGSPGKHPVAQFAPHGKDDATTDPGVIAEWLAVHHGNWGGRPPRGVVVLDIDVRSGGPDTLAALEAEHGALPATLTARTGSGGEHRWLSYNGPARGRLGRGIDVKTETGYVVLPPSIHACGGAYEWADQRPTAMAPRWVRTLLNPPIRHIDGTKGGNIDALIRFVADSAEGERNRRLFWASCRCAESSLDPTPLLDAAVQVGLPSVAALATIRSAFRAAPRQEVA